MYFDQYGLEKFNCIVGEIINHDELFEEERKRTGEITYINDIQVMTDQDALNLRDRLTIKYTGDIIDITEGSNPVEQPVEIDYWIRTPDGVDWFMNPIVKLMLDRKTTFRDKATKTTISLLSYFCDPNYRLPVGYVPEKRFKKLLDAGIPRGINEFEKRFDEFMEIWFGIKNRRGGYRTFKEPVYDLVQKYRDCVFVKHLPMYSRHVFAIEANDSYESMDKSVITFALDAVQTLTSLGMEIKPLTVKSMQSKSWKVNTLMAASVGSFLEKVFLKKEGMLRKSICGTPASFNTRCVIASEQRSNRHYQHLTIPWSVAMVVFGIEIGGMLIREHGYTVTDVFNMRSEYARKFDPFLNDMFKDFLAAHDGGAKPAVFHRPPTMERGSHQYMPIDGVNDDPRVMVIFMHNLSTKPFNADFDGDEMTCTILHDKKMAALFEPLSVHYGAMDLNSPLEFSGNAAIPKAHAMKLERFLNRHKR